MSLDLVKTIKAPFSGQDWIKKLIIGGILFIIPIVNFAMAGYVIKYLKNILNGNESTPDFSDFGGLFLTGIKAIVGSLLLFIPFGIICFIIGMLFSDAPIVANLIVYVFYIAYYFVAYILMARFAMDEKILSMVDFASAGKLLAGNKNTLLFVLFVIALGIVYGIVTIVCCITVIGLVLIPFLILASTLSICNLIGQFVKNSPNFEEVKASAN